MVKILDNSGIRNNIAQIMRSHDFETINVNDLHNWAITITSQIPATFWHRAHPKWQTVLHWYLETEKTLYIGVLGRQYYEKAVKTAEEIEKTMPNIEVTVDVEEENPIVDLTPTGEGVPIL